MLQIKTKIATPPSKKKKNKWKLGLVMERITRKKRERDRKEKQSWASFHKIFPLK